MGGGPVIEAADEGFEEGGLGGEVAGLLPGVEDEDEGLPGDGVDDLEEVAALFEGELGELEASGLEVLIGADQARRGWS